MKLTRSNPSRRRWIIGFTLLELMVAMVIAVIILAVMIQVTGAAVDTWQRNRDRVRAARQAEAVLDQIFKDFESIQMRSGNNFEWLYAGADDAVDDAGVSGGDAAKLAFFTGATDRYNGQMGVDGVDKGGDVSAVGYRLVYKDPLKNDTGEFAIFALYRNLIDPDQAFGGLLAQDELLGPGGQAGPFKEPMDEADSLTNFISENIYDFSLTFLIEYEKPSIDGTLVTKFRRITVADTSGANTVEELRIKGNGIFVEPAPADAGLIRNGRLVSVDIGITVITDTAMEIVRSGRFSGDDLTAAIAKYSYRFTKSANLPHL